MEKLTEVSYELEEAWLERKKNQLISCPLQPGSLRISEKACLKRHILGNRAKMLKFRDWAEIQRIGLSRCKNCPIGVRLKTKYKQTEVAKEAIVPRRKKGEKIIGGRYYGRENLRV